MIGVGFVVDEAMILRENRGRVDEVTWSKVQGAPATIAETQAYALRQLDALAEKLERKSSVGDLIEATQDAEAKAKEWLAVLARCFQLQDAISVLELDRVLDASPAEVDGHRLGLKAARQDRLARITRCTERLIGRLDAAAGTANLKVLTHPVKAPSLVRKSNEVSVSIVDFQGRLGIESGREQLTATRWADAANNAGAKALVKGSDGVDAAKRLGTETAVVARRLGTQTAGRARSSTKKLSDLVGERTGRKSAVSDDETD